MTQQTNQFKYQCVCFVQYMGYISSAVVPDTRPISPQKPKTRRQKEQFHEGVTKFLNQKPEKFIGKLSHFLAFNSNLDATVALKDHPQALAVGSQVRACDRCA